MEKREILKSLRLDKKENAIFKKVSDKYFNGNISEYLRTSGKIVDQLIKKGEINVKDMRKEWWQN